MPIKNRRAAGHSISNVAKSTNIHKNRRRDIKIGQNPHHVTKKEPAPMANPQESSSTNAKSANIRTNQALPNLQDSISNIANSTNIQNHRHRIVNFGTKQNQNCYRCVPGACSGTACGSVCGRFARLLAKTAVCDLQNVFSCLCV